MARRFENKVVWITGGGTGIGKALALAFGKEGATVAVSGRRQDRLQGVVDELAAQGGKGLAVRCDVTDEASVAEAVQKVVRSLGGLDVAVANAGFSVAGRVEKLSAADWRRQLDVNVIGVAMTARYAIPHLREREGRLALIGSVASMLATPGVGAYAASKYAVRAIGQVLAAELHGSGVSCTTIHPGYIESEIAQVDNQGRFDPQREDRRPKNLMWPADRAARVMVDAIAKRKREYTFTGHGKIGAFAGRHMPGLVHFGMTRNRK
ncbi:MAG: short-chain dehydrogenase [Myxococcales bacterium SG8_38_1]|jgi:NAD(P)-dependent dehydrogenase (short-subunit alcohol dehydrogenase family)|nr:MAG: short-chain dehydrogenase [Myxococcales bacterium SG8_38_1]